MEIDLSFYEMSFLYLFTFRVVYYFGINQLKFLHCGQERVAHACNPIYFGDGDNEDHGSGESWEKVREAPMSTNKTEIMEHVCSPSSEGGIGPLYHGPKQKV
jgi:hypothetical protein